MIKHKLVARGAGHPRKHWRLECQLIGQRGNIGLPSNPGDREALSLRESDTGISGLVGLARGGLGNVVETWWRELGAAIGDVNQQRAVATQRIGRAQQHDVGYGLHQASCIAWRFVDIGNDGVTRIGGVDGNGGARRHFYVRADAAKTASLKRWGTLQHLEGNHLSGCRSVIASCFLPSFFISTFLSSTRISSPLLITPMRSAMSSASSM